MQDNKKRCLFAEKTWGYDLLMDFVDKHLARRLESAEEMPQVLYARLYQKLRAEIGAEAEPFGGGHMVFAGLNSPIGRTVGAGFDGSVSADKLDRMEEFYRSHGAPAQIDVCPFTDPPLLEMLKLRGYAIGELNNVLYRCLGEEMGKFAPNAKMAKIRRSHSEEAGALANILVRSFFPEGNAPEGFASMLSPLFQANGVLSLVAEVDGALVACGASLMVPEHGIVALFGAGTLPEFRRRGLQSELLRIRLAAARDAGCEIAVVVTQAGTTSQRNAERLGFRVAYSKATLVKEFKSN